SSSGANSLEQQLLYVVMAIGFGLLTTSARVATGALWMSMGIHTSIDFLLIAPGGATLPVEPTTPDLYGGVLVVTAACLTATYLAIVLGAEVALAGRGQTVLSLIAVGFIAVAFQPLRQAVQHMVNRLMYGDRDDPTAVRAAGAVRPPPTLPRAGGG